MTLRIRRFYFVLGAVALACGVEETSPPTPPPVPVASSAVQPEAPEADPSANAPGHPSEEAPEPSEAESPPAPDASTPTVPSLADLLRLPKIDSRADAAARITLDPGYSLPGAPPKPSRLGVQFESYSDPAAVHPAKTRTQTNAEVSVDVTDSTRLRGGVRVQQESDTEPPARVPTIGIEKRF